MMITTARSRALMRRRRYPLTEPCVRPETIAFWATRNVSTMGRAPMTAPAASSPHFDAYSARVYVWRPTAYVSCDVDRSRVRARTYSENVLTTVMMKMTARIGRS